MISKFDFYDLKGKNIIFAGEKAKVLSIDDDDNVVFIRIENKPLLMLSFKEFLNHISAGNIHILKQSLDVVNAFNINSTQAETIRIREAYVLEMAKHKNPHNEVTRQGIILTVKVKIGDRKIRGGSTVSKWFKQWERDGYDIRKQVLLKNNKRRSRLSEVVEKIISKVINKHFLTREGKLRSECYIILKNLMTRLGMEESIPSIRSFYRRVDKVDPFELVRKRKGSSEAKKAFRKIKHKYNVSLPLELLELDTGNFNLGIIEIKGKDKYYIGSLSLHLCFCAGTGSLVGYSISIGKQGEQSGFIVNALYHAISRKCDKRYIQSGIPHRVVMDAGSGYISDSTRSFLDNINCTYDVTPTRQPWAKGFVERFIKHIRDTFFRGMKGYLGKYNPLEYTDANLKQAARVTTQQFRQKFANFVHEYHNTPQDRLDGLTPNEAWEKGIAQYPPMHIEDMAELKKFKGERVKNRKLNVNRGVFHRGYWFNTDELQSLYFVMEEKRAKKSDGIKVDLLVDPLNAGSVSVIVPANVSNKVGTLELIEAHNTTPNTEDKSFAQLEAKKKGVKELDGASCFIADKSEWTTYQRTPRKNGDKIDILLPYTPTDFDPSEELENILSTNSKTEFAESEPATPATSKDEECSHEEYKTRIL